MSSSYWGELTIRSWELKAYVQALMFCLTALFQAQLSIILSTAAYGKSYWTSVMPMILLKLLSIAALLHCFLCFTSYFFSTPKSLDK